MKSTTIDLFTFNHFILWLVIGYIYPNKYYLALFLGILWEVFERFIVYNKKLYNFVSANAKFCFQYNILSY